VIDRKLVGADPDNPEHWYRVMTAEQVMEREQERYERTTEYLRRRQQEMLAELNGKAPKLV